MRARSVAVLPALLAFAVPRAARAQAAVAEATADIDGDGQDDRIRIEAPGQLVIERAAGGGQIVPFGRSGALTSGSRTMRNRS